MKNNQCTYNKYYTKYLIIGNGGSYVDVINQWHGKN